MLIEFIVIVLIIFLSYNYFRVRESFVPYQTADFKEWKTGSTPLGFYNLPIYKPPYRYPFKYFSSYPYPYKRYYPTELGN